MKVNKLNEQQVCVISQVHDDLTCAYTCTARQQHIAL